MHEIEIDMIESQPREAGVEGTPDAIAGQMIVPDFCREVDVFAADAGGGDSRADSLLVAVHFSGIDVSISDGQCALDRALAFGVLHGKGAETEGGKVYALSLEHLHRWTSVTEREPAISHDDTTRTSPAPHMAWTERIEDIVSRIEGSGPVRVSRVRAGCAPAETGPR